MTLRFTKATRETGVDGHFTADDLRVTVKPDEFPSPLYPEDDGFWSEFGQTLDAVCLAHDNSRMQAGVAPGLEPKVRTGKQAADLVHADWPTEIITMQIRALKGVKQRAFSGLRRDFTDGVVMLNHVMSWAAHAVSPNSFAAKWHFMVPRPEEVAGAIARGEISAPRDIQIRLFDLVPQEVLVADQRTFTAYDEGSPDHPSYNAMHSAAAGAASAAAKVLLDLDQGQRDDIDLAARNMAFFRTVAGVHYPQDNRVGLWLGQETMKRLLPAKMESDFGISAAEVEAALAATAVDWLA